MGGGVSLQAVLSWSSASNSRWAPADPRRGMQPEEGSFGGDGEAVAPVGVVGVKNQLPDESRALG